MEMRLFLYELVLPKPKKYFALPGHKVSMFCYSLMKDFFLLRHHSAIVSCCRARLVADTTLLYSPLPLDIFLFFFCLSREVIPTLPTDLNCKSCHVGSVIDTLILLKLFCNPMSNWLFTTTSFLKLLNIVFQIID